ncbi:hypothetical protein FHL15_007114 [Xylaria flabelliformis]|uniref:Uncharacterized protein n=1 Tax=Xylaria flabelliformis TaxID=2512241 RepID=A0A553HVQ8_9PEZI|nr:hypothetical protein FHL15_007114 [Xylaria flabelliformis]
MAQVPFQPREVVHPDGVQSSVYAEKCPPASPPEPKKIYYLHDASPPPGISVQQVSGWIKQDFPATIHSVQWSNSLIIVNDDWKLVRSDSVPVHYNANKLVHAYRLYIEFCANGPFIPPTEYFDRLQHVIRTAYRNHGSSDIVVEIAMVHADRTLAAWYPPAPDTSKLKAYFEENGPDDSASKVQKKEKDSGYGLLVASRKPLGRSCAAITAGTYYDETD